MNATPRQPVRLCYWCELLGSRWMHHITKRHWWSREHIRVMRSIARMYASGDTEFLP